MPVYEIRYVSPAEFARKVSRGARLYGEFAVVGMERFGGRKVAFAVKA
jgi:hypothetical protein